MHPEVSVVLVAILLAAFVLASWIASFRWVPRQDMPDAFTRVAVTPSVWIQPCPFCNCDATLRQRDANLVVSCNNVHCFMVGPERSTEFNAIQDWNRIEVAI